jgi:hypothetical protein
MAKNILDDALADASGPGRRVAHATGGMAAEPELVMDKLAKFILATGIFTLACTILSVVIALSRMSRSLLS